MRSYDTSLHEVLINQPVSYRINGTNLREFGLEAQGYPAELFMPPVRRRESVIGARSGARNHGGVYDSWAFNVNFQMIAPSHDEFVTKRDKLARWLDIQQHRQAEFLVDKSIVKGIKFEIAGHKYNYTQGKVLATLNSATVVGYNDEYQVASGTASSNVANRLVDTGNPFTNVAAGYVAINTDDNTGAVVISKIDNNNLLLSSDAFPAGTENYIVYPSPYWEEHLTPDSRFKIGTVEYHIQHINYNGLLTLTANYAGSTARDLAYEGERKRYLVVDYNGTSSIGAAKTGVGAELVMQEYNMSIGFVTNYPYWISDLIEVDYGSVSANDFVKLRGIGTAASKPIYKVVGTATNPELTASEMALNAKFNGDYNARDIGNDADVTPDTQETAIEYVAAQESEGASLHDNDRIYFNTMNDNSDPETVTRYNADRFSAYTGMVSLFFVPSWSRYSVSDTKYIWWCGDNHNVYFSDGQFHFVNNSTTIDLTTPDFNTGDRLLITVGWDENVTTEVRAMIANLTDSDTGTETTDATAITAEYPNEYFVLGSNAITGGSSCEGIIDDLVIVEQMDSDFTATTSLHKEMYNSASGAVATEYNYPLLVYASFDGTGNIVSSDANGTLTPPSGIIDDLVSHNEPTLRVTATTTSAATVAANGNNIFSADDRVILWDETGYAVQGFVDNDPAPAETSVNVDDTSGAGGGDVANFDKVGEYSVYNGSTQYWSRADNAQDLDLVANEDGSMSIWLQTSSSTDEQYLFHKLDASNGYSLRIDGDGYLRGYLRAGGNGYIVMRNDIALDDGKWHEVTFVIDRSEATGLKLYIDGYEPSSYFLQDDPSADVATNTDNTRNFEIGRDGFNAIEYFNGNLRDAKFWKGTALTVANASTLATTPLGGAASPVATTGAWELMEDGNDDSGNGYTLTNNGTITFTQLAYISKNLLAKSNMEENGGLGALNVTENAGISTNAKDSTDAKVSSQSLKIVCDGSSAIRFSTDVVTVAAGEDYVARAWGKTGVSTDFFLAVRNNNTGGTIVDLTDPSGTTWGFLESCFEVPGACTGVRYGFGNDVALAGRTVNFDGFEILLNLIEGDCEAHGDWAEIAGSSLTTKADIATPHTGTNATRIVADANGEGVEQAPDVTPEANTTYEVSGWFRGAAGSEAIVFSVQGYASATGQTSKNITATTSYVRHSFIFTTAADTSGTVRITIDNGNDVYFDDISMVERYDTEAVAELPPNRFKSTAHDKGVLITSGDAIQYDARYANRKEFSFVARVKPQFDCDSIEYYYIFDYRDSSENQVFSLFFGEDTDGSVGTDRRWTFLVNGLAVTCIADQIFEMDNEIEISGWYREEGRSVEGTIYYAKLYVNGIEEASWASVISPATNNPETIYVGHKYNQVGHRAESVIDSLYLYTYALTDNDLVSSYVDDAEKANDNTTISYTGTLASDDILTIASKTGEAELFDASAGTMSQPLISGRSPDIRGTEEEEQTIYSAVALDKLIVVRRAHFR